jgi:hypothetical protein
MSVSINTCTCSMRRAALHRPSVTTPRPASPSMKTAPMTRDVRGVSIQGHVSMARWGARKRNTATTTARPAVAPITLRAAEGRNRSSRLGGASLRRLASQTPHTRKGVVKYSPAHSQKATWSWLNRSQCMIVAMPSSVANVPTATKPAFTVCHCVARKAWTKKYAPPM